jgi:hypothetical protein
VQDVWQHFFFEMTLLMPRGSMCPRKRRRLYEGNLRSRRTCIRIPLKRRHHKARLKWAMEHTQWTMQHWRHVLFTDVSRLCHDFTDVRV